MNMTAYLYGGRLFVVDCGVRFPDAIRLGTDAILPNVDPWFAEAGGVHSYIITHGHEDHLGALPYILPKWPAPVYATAWTVALLKNKLLRLGLNPEAFRIVTVEPGDRIKTEGFEVEFVHVNHSIPMACALYIRTPALNIFHTGDFKIDPHPVIEAPAHLARLSHIGDEGVDLLLADSTNADKAGHCPSETSVLEPLREVVAASLGAVVVSTFASNLWRIKTIAEVCRATGRKLYVAGAGMEATLNLGKSLGVYDLPPGIRIMEDELRNTPREELLVLASGCQGEWRAALARIAAGEHRAFTLAPGDTLAISARIIPGNEKALLHVLNACLKLGARIVTPREVPGIHVSGHAHRGDLDQLSGLIRPRRLFPVHGAYFQMLANAERGEAVEATDDVALVESGDVLDLSRDETKPVGRIDIELNYVDSDSRVVISYEALRERLRVGELGSALITGVYEKQSRRWLVPPAIELTGLRLPESLMLAGWLDSTVQGVAAEVSRKIKHLDDDALREEIRIFLRRQFFQVLKKKPVVVVKTFFV